MMFNHPNWFFGMIIWVLYIIIPFIFAGFIIVIANKRNKKKIEKIGYFLLIYAIIFALFGSSIAWHYQFEVPSVSEKTVTVQSWQPKAGIDVNENGLLVIDSADDLMMITSEGEGYLNEENFLFFKFNTRDVYNQLKVNGTYKIKYYGWREGFNDGFPNILSVDQIIDENNSYSNNDFGNVMVKGL